MEENSIIFLDLNDIHLGTIIQDYDSSISHLTSTFRIEWSLIEHQYPLSLHLEILKQLYFLGFQ